MTLATSLSRRCRARRVLASTTALMALALAAPAYAQDDVPDPPTIYNLDVNGVDVASGTFYLPMSPLDIGQAGAGLSFQTVEGSASFDSYDTRLFEDSSGITVNLGPISDFFSISRGYSKAGTGAKLTAQVPADDIYTARDGTVYFFDDAYKQQRDGISQSKLSTITHPDGRVETLHYQIVPYEFCTTTRCTGIMWQATRVSSVTTNDGYEFDFTYQSNNTLCDFNDVAGCLRPWMHRTGVSAKNNAGTAPTGGWPSISFGSASGAKTITDAMGHVWTISYSSGKIVGVRPPGSAADTITLTYDTNGRVHTVNRGGSTWTYTYAETSTLRTTTVTDPDSHTHVVVSWLDSGRIKSDTDELSHTTAYEYDTSGNLTKVTYDEGNYVIYEYDARSNLKKATAHPKSGTGTIVTSASFDTSCSNIKKCNKPNSTTDARGHTTTYTYEPTTGQIATVTHPAPTTGAAQPQERYSYTALHAWYKNSSGTLIQDPTTISKLTGISQCITGTTCAGTANEVKTTIAYGANSVANNRQPSAVTKAAGNGSVSATTAFTYDGMSNVATVDGPLSGTADTTTYRYDLDRKQVGVISPDPDGAGTLKRRAQRVSYADDGLVTKSELGTVTGTTDSAWAAFASLQQANTTYDSYRRKVKDTLTAGGTTYAVTQYNYDTLGRPDCTAVRMNSATWGSQPAVCTPQTTGSAGPDRITKTSYDWASQVTKTTSAYGVTGVQADDATATWTGNGKLATVTDAEGNKTTYEYDGYDRLVKTRYPSKTTDGSSSTTDYEQFTLDDNGNVTSRRLRDGTSIGYTIDNLDRVTHKNLPGSEPDIDYIYDNLGRLTNANQTSGTNDLTFGYDALGRLLTQAGPLGTMTSTYDTAGRRTKLAWPDTYYVNYDYLVTGEMTKVRENGAASGVGLLATYTYDDLGRRTGVTRGNGVTTSYAWDPVSRLQTLTQNLASTANDLTLGFGYNPAGQITQATRSNTAYSWTDAVNGTDSYTANGLNQYTAASGQSLGYDNRGNLTSIGGTTYAYSSENLLTSGPSVTLAYDPLLRLYETAGSTTTRFGYDGLEMAGEYNTAGALTERYVFGPGVDEPLIWYHGSGTSDRRWLIADERGSIVAATNSTGNPITGGIQTYDEYGQPGSGTVGRLGFTGQSWLSDLGLSYYKARMYSPSLGRFMQTDPIEYEEGMNLYNYVGSDPVNFVDPSGMLDVPPGTTGCSQEPVPPDVSGTHGAMPICNHITVTASRGIPRFLFDLINHTSYYGQDRDSGVRAGKGTSQKVTLDKSCVGVGPAEDPAIQAKALKALQLGQTAQQRDPSGPRFREYGFSGRSYFFPIIFGHGYVTGEIQKGSETNVRLKEGYFDTFDVHAHPDPNANLGPSGTDKINTPSGFTTIVINTDRVLRCYTGK